MSKKTICFIGLSVALLMIGIVCLVDAQSIPRGNIDRYEMFQVTFVFFGGAFGFFIATLISFTNNEGGDKELSVQKNHILTTDELIPIEDFCLKSGKDKSEIIQKLRNSDLLGKYTDDQWFVNKKEL